MIGCFYDHGRWVALHLQSHPETGDTLVVARLGECPGDADGHDVPLASRPTAGAALDRALHRLTDGWRHASDEPPAPPASARAAIAHPAPLPCRRGRRPGRHARTGARRRRVRDDRRPARVLLLREPRRPLSPPEPAHPAGRPTTPTHPHTRRTLMSLTASPLADAPYAATIHTVELDDFGHSFRPVAPGLFTCPIDVARLEVAR